MRARLLLAFVALALGSPVAAQTPLDSLRAEAVRSRAFIRAAETQLSKVLDMLARMGGDPIGEPIPPDTTVPPPEPAPAPDGLLFASSWGTGRGWTPDAYTDGGKWDYVSGDRGTPNKEVVSTEGLDFPMPNAYRVHCTAVSECWSMLRKTGLPVPAVGESRFYRWYFRLEQPDNLGDVQTHPIQDGNASSQSNWMFIVYNAGSPGMIPAGQWQPQFWATSTPYPHQRWWGPLLSKRQTYRFELHMLRTGTSAFQMHVRVYDSAGELIAGDADFQNAGQGETLARSPTFVLTSAANLDGLNSGNNGIAPPALFPFTYAYESGFCVRSDTWCGPYRDGI